MAVPHDAILGRLPGERRHPRLHREIVQREAGVARAERAQMLRAIREHRRALVRARGEAHRGGRQLLRILDKLPHPD